MKYYVNPKKKRIKPMFLVIISILMLISIVLYMFDKKVFPYVLQKSETMVKAKAVDVISEVSMEVFNKEFKYDDVIKIDKDANKKKIDPVDAMLCAFKLAYYYEPMDTTNIDEWLDNDEW